jgi:hypothetical protein
MARRELRRRGLGHDAFGARGVLNDTLSIYFSDPTLASAFVARWCAGYKIETVGTPGIFVPRQYRQDAEDELRAQEVFEISYRCGY